MRVGSLACCKPSPSPPALRPGPKATRDFARGFGMRGVKRDVRALLSAAMFAIILQPSAASALPRVASTTVCADQYLLALAEPAQIAALSAYARDPTLSAGAARAQGFPQTRGTAEELIALKPDLVLGEAYSLGAARPLLSRVGIKTVLLPSSESFAEIEEALRLTGLVIGRSARGKEAAAALARRREALAERRAPERLRALYLLPSGSTAGRGTFIHDVLEAAGLENYAAARGLKGWGRASLEALVHDPPALLVLGFFDRRVRSVTMGFAASPLFQHVLAQTPRLEVPNALWICAGPMIIEAAEYIAARLPQAALELATESAP